MKQVIISSEKIITRAGYSTIMELVSLNSSALLVPTPGQTEQEYLGEYLSSKGLFYYLFAEKFNAMDSPEPAKEAWPVRI